MCTQSVLNYSRSILVLLKWFETSAIGVLEEVFQFNLYDKNGQPRTTISVGK